MPVIINELDVVTDDTATAPAPAAPPSAPAATPTPFELRTTLRHMASRADRLRVD